MWCVISYIVPFHITHANIVVYYYFLHPKMADQVSKELAKFARLFGGT